MELSLPERLSALPPNQWLANAPASPASIDALEQKYRLSLPTDYRGLLLVASGGGLYGHPSKLNLESADNLLWHNDDPRFTAGLPGMLVIGDDNGDAIYYFDPVDRLGRGGWALFQVDLSMLGFPYSKFAARNLSELMAAILSDEQIWERAYIGPIDGVDRAT